MADRLVIRAALLADAEAVAGLDREWTPILGRAPRFRRAASEGHLVVAELDHQLVGYAALGGFFGYDFLELLAVHPDFRRQGIATSLIKAIQARCTSGKLFTSTNTSNRPMRALCRRLGFRRSGRIDNLDEADPELVYLKLLETARTLDT
jgi:GNAT superfamily N-acetyltransferase